MRNPKNETNPNDQNTKSKTNFVSETDNGLQNASGFPLTRE